MVESVLRIEEEPELCFIVDDGTETCQDVKTMLVLLGEEQCSDETYDERKSICDGCEHLKKGELCEVDRRLVRLENRFQNKKCPIDKW
jgi:hypothetical protein